MIICHEQKNLEMGCSPIVFLKPLQKLEFADIEQLMSNKICESEILDYKEELLEDDKLLKQVCAFANTQGGFLVFGVKESGNGGYPTEILGIDKNQINRERMEQIVLGNIQPRLNIKTKLIEHHDPSRAFVIVQIPDSYLKPHMNSRDNKFYRRYQFEALPMTEIQVSETYRKRLTGYEEVEDYISALLELKEFVTPQIIGQIVVIPTILYHMIDTSSVKEFGWMNNLDFEPKYYDFSYVPSSPMPSTHGIRCQLKSKNGTFLEELEIHRNGCMHYTSYFGEKYQEKMIFLYHIFCLRLLHTFQFVSALYQRYNFFGDLRFRCKLQWLKDSYLPRLDRTSRILEDHPCQTNEISISRDFPITVVESKHEYVASGIMNEIFNSYGFWKCPLFDDEGNLKNIGLS